MILCSGNPDIEKVLERLDGVKGTLLDTNSVEHMQLLQDVICAFPVAVKRALAAEARVRELLPEVAEVLKFLIMAASGEEWNCSMIGYCDDAGDNGDGACDAEDCQGRRATQLLQKVQALLG